MAELEERKKQKEFKSKGTKIVVIDPGHGGEDPGAIGPKKTMEKDIVLKVGMKVVHLLNQNKESQAFLTRKGDYFESDDYVLSSAVGHLLGLTLPPEHDVKKGKWSFAKLPVIPPHFDLAPIEKRERRLNMLLKLLKRKDVTGIINACDAGREGELIFRYIAQYSKTKKPIG